MRRRDITIEMKKATIWIKKTKCESRLLSKTQNWVKNYDQKEAIEQKVALSIFYIQAMFKFYR